MWLRFTFTLAFWALASQATSSPLDLPGDMLAKGQQFGSSKVSVRDWYYSGEFVANANKEDVEDTARGFADANNSGYGFETQFTYMYGVSELINIGVRYGYVYEKEDANVDSDVATDNGLYGDLTSEGGTDLTLLVKYRLYDNVSFDGELMLPICSANQAQDVCSSKLAAPSNADEPGQPGGQGNGYYRIKTGLSANWLSETDDHWFSTIFAAATLADDAYSQKASSPFVYGASFGAINNIKQNHNWTAQLKVERFLEHSSYSEQAQTQADYGAYQVMSFEVDYLWDWQANIQVKPFFVFSMDQQPSQTFVIGEDKRRLEYTAGTQFTLGTELSASF